MRRFLLALATVITVAMISPLISPMISPMARADMVGAAAGAGTGLVVAGPVGAVAGGVVGAVFGEPFWGPPISHGACWIDNTLPLLVASSVSSLKYRNRPANCSPEVSRGACGCAQKAYLTSGTCRLFFSFGCLSNSTQRELGQMSYEFT
jgi:osmotically inducible lipoprotein OsmB